MRFFTAVAAAASIALTADARIHHTSYAKKVVERTRNHLEGIHGKGLTGLFDENGRVHGPHFKKGFKS